MSFPQLKKELDRGHKRDLYIFTGDEREVMRKYIRRIDENPVRVSDIKTAVQQMTTKGLFSMKRTFLIEDDKGILDLHPGTLLDLSKQNRLIVTFKTMDKRTKFFKTADTLKLIVSFDRFTEEQLVAFIVNRLPITPEVAVQFARYCGNDVAQIELAMNKIHHLMGWVDVPVSKDEITIDTIKKVVTPPLEDRVFDMIDAVAANRRDDAFALYYDLKKRGESPFLFLSLLYTKFKALFLVQFYFQEPNPSLCAKTGLSFYQVNLTRQLVGHFSTDRLLYLLRRIQAAEVQIKTGQLDAEIGMDLLLLNILA